MKLGVHSKEPDVFAPFGVNVAPDGSGAAVREVIVSPSGSEAVTPNVRSVPSDPEAVPGAVTAGARSTFAIVI
ncbi:MAG TPA: hypothetical protein VFP58_01020, partial [Candidatus Eisenbacteria bacterium]|nr:hypothetical protein [Candidatus Eisenbacteria bacterium]